ncbi:alkyl hydroperoxide reductase/ Thiol specific antioxidant/ Mal allergen [Ruminiclostridium papyrosolvens DSM 2782]|uniref:Alkyl hydroperoxide reductase/ Thiol specific antioxidant/ Mal allergen n=1 Tax=Ruminiclostridium papyrosolvens DSM 2782 TaxID=588581 RepID=F1TDE5_9FIRM|nr:TlpA disulfide reductase family protein [Ruminiclostridium papyrosolvens]EGD47583.1 alkyl hydroperoxide reductase/ Thiol specific antioxidant/ Mal allergen [Ruminiclostridium papyrosolvens DSM 2782]WES36472.1 TlpA disulfide reductase family protein [Ruminiclostridium papyrosolvens DSM 2782]
MNKKLTIVIWSIVAVAIIAAAYTFYSKTKIDNKYIIQPQEDSQQSQSAQSSKLMAPDFNLKDINGKTVKLSDYKGKKVILNFWAVWCKYCLMEMPDFNELNKELVKDNNAVILAVDVQETEEKVKEYLTSNNISLNVLMDTDGAVSRTYRVSGYPTTFFINKDGSLYTYIPQKTDKNTVLKILEEMENSKD